MICLDRRVASNAVQLPTLKVMKQLEFVMVQTEISLKVKDHVYVSQVSNPKMTSQISIQTKIAKQLLQLFVHKATKLTNLETVLTKNSRMRYVLSNVQLV